MNITLSEQLIHSLKTGLACLLGFILIKIIHVGVDQWLLITILVVMCAQINVGSIIQKSTMRLIGTLTGSAIAILTLELFGTDTAPVLISIVLSSMLFSYIATSETSFSDSGTLGAVTVIIILIGQHPSITTALSRFLEISAGIFIAAIVSQFVLPIHATVHLRKNQAETLRQLGEYYSQALLHKKDGDDLVALDEKIVKSLIAQRKLAKDAAREAFLETTSIAKFNQLLWCEKEILRSIIFMHHSRIDTPLLQHFHTQICDALNKIALGIEKQKKEIVIIPTLEQFKQAILPLENNHNLNINAFEFCTTILIARLDKLSSLMSEVG